MFRSIITKLQNLKLQQDMRDVVEYIDLRYHERSLFTLGVSLLAIIVFTGGLFFWSSQLSFVFGRNYNQNELAVARSGLQTIKRMVGDQQAWSKSIQEEYNRIFVGNTTKMQPISYGESFIGDEHSTNMSLE
ncbi:MAG: hypothetical protein A2735_02875 [Candidatus Yanofskybacteria bacterium RIFCSPHIGHO2_01_FULL_41_21]|uniref:Uncharacterized protein n=2 Tax=Candidatus Yanofskyibacteriota TaxID=1752733 RepID=A0A0G0WK64_9BACT|nr:MAG: hypothetical protein UU70_C0021G0005 [Candidatus Yanofskybacteria bacterium GW2011_GWA1_41_6]OGM97879.1 MAG: hypothetical protein A2735_02875 [Candidatus Yanofskybacteria bacterium RIFCSPHIGHO2_01_FULL_41_21]